MTFYTCILLWLLETRRSAAGRWDDCGSSGQSCAALGAKLVRHGRTFRHHWRQPGSRQPKYDAHTVFKPLACFYHENRTHLYYCSDPKFINVDLTSYFCTGTPSVRCEISVMWFLLVDSGQRAPDRNLGWGRVEPHAPAPHGLRPRHCTLASDCE